MKKTWLAVTAAVLTALAGAAWALGPVPQNELKVGFVYVGPVGDGGWSFMHDQGRIAMEKALPGVTGTYVESVAEGPDCVRVLETFVKNGARLIFATSFGFMDAVQEVAKKYPDVAFMHCSGFKMADNAGIYFGRIYQASYLAGLVAGKMTAKGQIGYIATHPIPEILRDVNAFTLGVRKTRPDATVKVVWLFSWFDPGKEREAAKALLDAGCDLLAMDADSGAAVKAAEEAGVYVVGYNNDMSNYAPTKHLVSPIWDWSVIYADQAKKVIDGTWKPEDIWWGLESGLVKLSAFGPAVPEDVKALVAEEEAKMRKGEWDVFTGPVRDQAGQVVVPDGTRMTDKEMLEMGWLVEGAEGSIPKP